MASRLFRTLALTLVCGAFLLAIPQVESAAPQYTISGHVWDWDGAPLSGVIMRGQLGGTTIAETITDASGAYSLTASAGFYEVSAYKEKWPLPPVQYVTLPPGAAGVDFTFPRRYLIAGTVRDHSGAPVADAQVVTASNDPFYAYAYTEDTGCYTLTVLAGVYRLSLLAPGLTRSLTATLTVPPDALAIDFTLPERYQVSGTVRDWHGASVAGARVSVTSGGKEYAVASSLTDSAGAYTLTLGAATYNLGVYKQGHLSPLGQEITVPPARSGVDLTFLQPYTIRGTVRDTDGTAVEGVSVSARRNYWTVAAGVTDAAGAYTLTVAAGAYSIVASRYPWPDPPARTVSVPPDAVAVDFTFPPRYAIRGAVRYHDGTPVDRASIVLRTGDGTSNVAMTRSDATGAYAFTVAAGAYSVGVGKDNLQAPPPRLVVVPPDADAVDFTLLQHYTVTGTVRDWTGAAAAYVGVSALTANDKIAASAETSHAGEFQLLLNAGTYRVRARRAGQPATPEAVVTLPPSAACLDIVLPEPYTIRGTVRDHTGAPVRGAEVFIRKGSGDGSATRTAADGTYTLLAPAGRWAVHVEFAGYLPPAAQSVDVPPAAVGIDFTLPAPAPPSTISGFVRDQYGAPLDGVTVYGGVNIGTTAADGAYTITARAAVSENRIEAYKKGYKGLGTLTVPIGRDAVGVDFALRALDGMIYGQVLDATDQPVAGARVRAWNIVCPSLGGGFTTTDTSGAYTITLPTGPYRVYLYADGYVTPVVREIVLGADGGPPTAEVDFTLPPLTPPPFTISGRVVSSAGQPVTNAGVQASACGRLYATSGDVTGAYTLSVTAGAYALYAYRRSPPLDPGIAGFLPEPTNAAEASSATVARMPSLVSVPPCIAGVAVTLTPAGDYPARYAVRGRVTDDQGQPVEGAYVSTAGPRYGYYETDLSDADGIFVLGLSAGTYRISAYKSGYARPAPLPIVVPPSRIGVDLTLALAPQQVAVTVSGSVRDAQGRLVPYADICTEPAGVDLWWDQTCQQVYYDGTYALSLEPGMYRLWAREMDSCAAPAEAREIAVFSMRTDIDFVVRAREQLISGQVTDDLGRPLCGADIGVSGETLPHATSDGQGMYDLPMPAGAYTLTATKPGYDRGADQPVIVPPRATAVNFVLPLPANLIRGAVRDLRGVAIPGATVQIDGPATLDPIATDADGRYTVYAPDGDWRVVVSRPGYTAFPALQSISLPPSPTQADFVLVADAEIRRFYLPVLLRSGGDTAPR